MTDNFDFWRYVVTHLTQGGRIDYLICDEAQFYSPDQVDTRHQDVRAAARLC